MRKTVNPPEVRARHTKNTRAYRARHPGRVKESRRKVYLTRKVRAIKMVGELRCNRCGCDDFEFLEFNHIGGGGSKEYRENGRLSAMELLLIGKRKPEGLEILCRVCNALDYLERKNLKSAMLFTVTWNGGQATCVTRPGVKIEA